MGSSRDFTVEMRRRVAEEAIAEGNVSEIARRYSISRRAVTRWMRDHERGQLDGSALSAAVVDRVLEENRELKRLLGEKELQVSIMEDLLKKTLSRSGTKSK